MLSRVCAGADEGEASDASADDWHDTKSCIEGELPLVDDSAPSTGNELVIAEEDEFFDVQVTAQAADSATYTGKPLAHAKAYCFQQGFFCVSSLSSSHVYDGHCEYA